MIERHRLAFFPSPYLDEFQNNPEIYLQDEIYADVVARNVLPVPIRFDYNASKFDNKELTHPMSHMTLGQYKNCRIPVSSPLTPTQFIDFILRSFYHTAFTPYADSLPANRISFDETIRPFEKNMVYVSTPS